MNHFTSKLQSTSLPAFHYQISDLKARKIVTLINFSKLPYSIQQTAQFEAQPCLLTTSKGELTDQYEIINYIVNDSFMGAFKNVATEKVTDDSLPSNGNINIPVLNLSTDNILVWTKLNEKLYELRTSLFPLLDQLYSYLLGHQIVKKSVYDAICSRVKKEVMSLDQFMQDHEEIFKKINYLSIIITCELFLACRFLFTEQFRKTKQSLFSCYQEIANTEEFVSVFGKSHFCTKECLPVQFQEDQTSIVRDQDIVHLSIAKLVESTITNSENVTDRQEVRNQLLYNFFKNKLQSRQSKNNYFPYFWLMFDNLSCNIIQLQYFSDQPQQPQQLIGLIQLLKNQFAAICRTSTDFGFLGVFKQEMIRNFKLQGLFCIGSLEYEQFCQLIKRKQHFDCFKIVKVNVNREEERRRVQTLWEHQTDQKHFENETISFLQQF